MTSCCAGGVCMLCIFVICACCLCLLDIICIFRIILFILMLYLISNSLMYQYILHFKKQQKTCFLLCCVQILQYISKLKHWSETFIAVTLSNHLRQFIWKKNFSLMNTCQMWVDSSLSNWQFIILPEMMSYHFPHFLSCCNILQRIFQPRLPFTKNISSWDLQPIIMFPKKYFSLCPNLFLRL